jgi:hypothetical protein
LGGIPPFEETSTEVVNLAVDGQDASERGKPGHMFSTLCITSYRYINIISGWWFGT